MLIRGKWLLEDSEIQRNTLYQIKKTRSIAILEKDSDITDVVNCEICMASYNEAVFSREYIGNQKGHNSGGKKADIMCIMLNETERMVKSYAYEIKHAVSGADRVIIAMAQIEASMLRNRRLVENTGIDWQEKISEQGIITSRINEDAIKHEIERIRGMVADYDGEIPRMNRTISKKRRIEVFTEQNRKNVLERFLKGQINVEGRVHELHNVKLEQKDNRYECSLVFA